MSKKGSLVIISGFSGAGKGTVVKELMKNYECYALSISATTRNPRPGEENGREYFFKTKEEFEELIRQDALYEYAQYVDNYYGTPKAYVEEQLAAGKDVILEIEVQGAQQVMQKCPDAVSIFIAPPSMTELEKRLRGRGTEAEEVIQKRLATASGELKDAPNYKYLVVNDQVETAAQEILTILAAEQIHQINKEEKVKEVLES